jgi:uncharacterized protein (TIGR03083 family)
MTGVRIDEVPEVGRALARQLAATEYRRLAEQLRSLGADDWVQPTDCPAWDVRAMAGHCVGMLSDFTSFGAMVRRMRSATRLAKRDGVPTVDAMTALQVADHADLTTDELIVAIEEHGPTAARWRTGAPALLRAMPMKEVVGGRPETWRIGYLLDTILTRDPWMHRIDIARATGREPVHTPDHDGRIVADVVAEWARRHGQPFTLTLTGPAGGRFVGGHPPASRSRDASGDSPGDASGDTPGEALEQRGELELDAIEFCRILSGRADGSGLLAWSVPF